MRCHHCICAGLFRSTYRKLIIQTMQNLSQFKKRLQVGVQLETIHARLIRYS
jgi:hypothetical protein